MTPIPGFPNYFATEDGEIWSTKIYRGDPGPRRLVGGLHEKGYRFVLLYVGKARKIRSVHSLVALAFLGSRPAGLEVMHLDENALNNSVSNLAYGTPEQNTASRVAKRTHCRKGHELTKENVYLRANSKGSVARVCRQCTLERRRVSRD